MMRLEHNMIGQSAALVKVIDFITKVARRKSHVLIYGESGTGKELAAQAIHRNSGLAGPFLAINCAAIPETVLENELFGHEREAFTGANSLRIGKFEQAQGGTLFLDEIGETSRTMQAMLLRVVEYGEFQRIGGTETIRVNTRLIAATNRDLKAMVAAREFREDLYYRLDVLSLKMPPLRERCEDIPLLARNFLELCAKESGCDGLLQLSPEAEAVLCQHRWPGNVRELLHVIIRAAALTTRDVIRPEDLEIEEPPLVEEAGLETFEAQPLDDAVLSFKRDYVRKAVVRAKGNLTKAAKMLGIHPAGFARLLDKLGLSDLKGYDRTGFGTT